MTVPVARHMSLGAGDHALFLFDSEELRRRWLAMWVGEGRRLGEQLVFLEFAGRSSACEVDAQLRETPIHLQGPEPAPKGGRDWVVEGIDGLGGEGVPEWLRTLSAQALEQGFAGIRVVNPPLGEIAGWDSVLAVERAVEAVLPSLPASQLCLYEATRGPHVVEALASAHTRLLADPFLEVRRSGSRVRVAGELDFSNVQLLQTALGSLATAPTTVHGVGITLDFRDLDFIDAAGLGAVSHLADSVAPRPLQVVGGQSHIVALFRLMGLDHLLG